MAATVGLISSTTHLAEFASKACKTLVKELQAFPRLPQQVRDVRTEVSSVDLVLETLLEIQDLTLDVDLTALRLTLEQCKRACDEVSNELQTYCSKPGFDHASFRDWFGLRCGSGDGIGGFRQQLIGYKSTISVALSFFNLRTSMASAKDVRVCRDTITTAMVDLETHLDHIQQKLRVLTQQTVDSSHSDAAIYHYMEDEQLSTEKALHFCTLLAQKIQQISDDFYSPDRESVRPHNETASGILFGSVLESCMHQMQFTRAQLEKQQQKLDEHLKTGSKCSSADDQALCNKLQKEAQALHHSLRFCSDVDSQISNIENVAQGNDTIQFMVSTNSRPMRGKNRGVGNRLKQAGGHFDEASLQQLSRDFRCIALSHTEQREEGNDAGN